MQNKFHLIFIIGFSLLLLQCSGDRRLYRELVEMADNLNKSVPAQLDDHTIFLGADVTEGNVFQYRYQLVNTAEPQSMLRAVEDRKSTRLNSSH